MPVSRRTILVGVAAVAVASHMKSGGATRRSSPEMDELRRRWHALVHRFESMTGVDAENPLWELLDRSFDRCRLDLTVCGGLASLRQDLQQGRDFLRFGA